MSLINNNNTPIGKILKPHGIKGDIKILPFSTNLKGISQLPFFHIKLDNCFQKFVVSSFKPLNRYIVFHFQGYDSYEAVEQFRNQYLYLDRQEILNLSSSENTSSDTSDLKEEYLVDDLINFELFLLSNENRRVGSVTAYYSHNKCTGIYEVTDFLNKKKAYIPCDKEFFYSINSEQKKIVFNDYKMSLFFQ